MNFGWWTFTEINKCKELFENGKTIKEIAIALDRCEMSIQNLLKTERVTLV